MSDYDYSSSSSDDESDYHMPTKKNNELNKIKDIIRNDKNLDDEEDDVSEPYDEESNHSEDDFFDENENEVNEIVNDYSGGAKHKKSTDSSYENWNQIVHELDEDEMYSDEQCLKKIENETSESYFQSIHPETIFHNYDEMTALSIVIRDEQNNIIDPLHKTIPFLTKYEKSRILGQRTKQIDLGSEIFVDIPEHIIDSYTIAEMELKEKKIPFIIRRPIVNGTFEYWKVSDLEIID
jgi:DNA-directed RNA polymerase I, II, and III subunit RPABC2